MRRIAVIGLLVLLVVAGCQKGRSLDGKWKAKTTGAAAEMDAEFAGSKLTLGIKQPFELSIVFNTALSGEELTLTIDEYKFGQLPDMIKSQAEAQAKSQKGKVSKVKVVWQSDDEVTLTPITPDTSNPLASMTLNLTRVKS